MATNKMTEAIKESFDMLDLNVNLLSKGYK